MSKKLDKTEGLVIMDKATSELALLYSGENDAPIYEGPLGEGQIEEEEGDILVERCEALSDL